MQPTPTNNLLCLEPITFYRLLPEASESIGYQNKICCAPMNCAKKTIPNIL